MRQNCFLVNLWHTQLTQLTPLTQLAQLEQLTQLTLKEGNGLIPKLLFVDYNYPNVYQKSKNVRNFAVKKSYAHFTLICKIFCVWYNILIIQTWPIINLITWFICFISEWWLLQIIFRLLLNTCKNFLKRECWYLRSQETKREKISHLSIKMKKLLS